MRDLLGCCYGDCGLGATAPASGETVQRTSAGDPYLVRSNTTTESGRTIQFLEPEVIAVSRPANTSAWIIAAAAVGGAALLLGGKKPQRRRRKVSHSRR